MSANRPRRPAMPALAWLLGGLVLPAVLHAQQPRYWVGGNGAWDDPMHWAASAEGPGGAGAPRKGDAAIIAPGGGETIIRLERDAQVGGLLVDGGKGRVAVQGKATRLRVAGDLSLRGNVAWDQYGTVELVEGRSMAWLDLRGIPLGGSMRITGGTWGMRSDLVLGDHGGLELQGGTLVTNGSMLKAGRLVLADRGARLMAGSSVVLLGEPLAPRPSLGAVDPGTSRLLVAGVPADWGLGGAAERDERAQNVCATDVGQVPFTINAQLMSNYNGFGVSCHGVCDGQVRVVVGGGVGPFIYSWVGGPASATWNNVCPGNQIVIVTDQGQGVSCATTVQVTDPSLLSVIFTGTVPPACAGVCNGSSMAFAVGGVPGYTYSWNNGAGTGASFGALCPGTNTLHVTDANGCAFDTTFSYPIQPIAPNLMVSDVQCANGCDGTASVAPTGGTGAFTYDWGPGTPAGDGTSQVSGLCAGDYAVTIRDANGCDTTLHFQVNEPLPIIPNAVHVDATCGGTCNGSASVSPSGGSGTYTYAWSPGPGAGQGTASATGLCAGTYTVTIEDVVSGCDTVVTITIQAPPILLPNPSSTDVTCSADCDGTATVAPSGGTTPYSYAWTPAPPVGQNQPSASQLCPGTWSVTIRDWANCDTTVVFTIQAPAPISVNAAHTEVTCAGACDGTASAPAAGGTGSFTYLWQPGNPAGQGTPEVTGLCAGNWSVAITDQNGCDTTVQFVIQEPLPLAVAGSQTAVTCGNSCDGTATVAVDGGTQGYTYTWTPEPGSGQGTATAEGLCPGDWTVLVEDAHGCTASHTFTILPAVPMAVVMQATPATCFGLCDGEASASVGGGVPGYAYTWHPAPASGQGTPSAVGLCAGTGTLTVTDAAGCDTTISFTIAEPPAIGANAAVTDPACAGACDGAIVLAPTGGNGTYTYAWTPAPPNGNGTAQATGLCAGDQAVRISSGGCDTLYSFTLQEPPAMDVALNAIPATCADACDGTGELTGTLAGLTFTWSPEPASGQGTANVAGLCPGPGTVRVANAAGCDTVIAFTLQAPEPIAANAVVNDASCGGTCDGSIMLAVSGGTPGYSFHWSPEPGSGQGTASVGGLCPGDYAVTITDANGCTAVLPFTIARPAAIDASGAAAAATCADACDGTITVTAAGGMPAYTWAWTPEPASGQGMDHVGGLCPGTWTVTIGDQAGCDTTLAFEITAPDPIDPQGTFTNESCNGPCDGTAAVSPAGGAGGFTYNWSPAPPTGQGTASASGLCAGDWCVTITDAGGCDTTWCFTILQADPVQASVSTADGGCPGACTGQATVAATGGAGGYTYVWNPEPADGQGSPTAAGLCAGPVSVTITDAAGCDTTITFHITDAPPIVPNLGLIPENCTMPCSGAASVSPTGGSGTFVNYEWDPPPASGQGTGAATGLCAGTAYTVTITDSQGCGTTVAFTVPDTEPVQATVQTVPATCADACNGTATVQAPTGGTPPYTYFWSPPPPHGQGTPVATGLCPGDYTVTVGDVNGCTTLLPFTVTAPPPIDAQATVTPIGCGGDCTGAIDLDPVGGQGGYGYLWSPAPGTGQGTTHAGQLCAGDWAVVITDAVGCGTIASFTLTAPQPMALSADVAQSHCGQCDGSVDLQVAGGIGPYVFHWGPPLNTATNDGLMGNLCAGAYPVTVVDATGCEASMLVAVTDEDGEVLSMTDGATSCPGACDGTVSVGYTCTVPPCIVAWADLSGAPVAVGMDVVTGLCAGTYIAIVANGNGCLTMDTAYVMAPAPLTADISSTPVSCAGACDGTATIHAVGGTGAFGYTWMPEPGAGQGTPHATGLCAGVYDVLVQDAGGCDATFSVLITAPPPLAVDAAITAVSCAGGCDGGIALDVQGGAGTPVFFWSPLPPIGQGTATVNGLCAGIWTVTISGGGACDTTLIFDLADPGPIVGPASFTPSHCGVCDGTATVAASGGTGPLTVQWSGSGGPIGTGGTVSGLCAGIYTATIADAHGCSLTQTVVVPDAGAEPIQALGGQTPCQISCEGQVSVSYLCADVPCTVTWFDLGGLVLGSQDTLSGLCPGTYLVQVVNGSGCASMDTAMVVPAQLIVPNLGTTPPSCHDACNGTATVGPTGGVGPYTYAWSPEPGGGQGTPQATGLCAGTYQVLITDASGCDITVQVLITAPQPITVGAHVEQVTCAGAADGSIVLSPSGGAGLFAYQWSPVPPNGQGNNAALGIGPGDWTVRVTDFQGCDTTMTFTITEPAPLAVSVSATLSSCALCNGTADAVPSGGTGPYGITWLRGGTVVGNGTSVAGLCAGLYVVRVEDAHGCSVEAPVPVEDAGSEELSTTGSLLDCTGSCDGTAEVSFTCSDAPCTIAWLDAAGHDLNETGNTLSGLCAGLYLVQVTNGSGCISLDTAYVRAPDPILANLATTPEHCPGSCDGTATVGPTGGAGGYTYAWDIGGTTITDPQVPGLCAGTYSVEITDAAGCSITQDVLILSPPSITATAVAGPITCNGACDGSIHLAAQGGTGALGYQWSPQPPNGQGTGTATGLCAGTWSVTITDANSCDTTFSVTLNDPPVLSVDLSHTDNACHNDCAATAQVDMAGGVPPYAITWTGPGGSIVAEGVDEVSGLCGGAYQVVVTDFRHCSVTTDFTVARGDAIEANLSVVGESCNGPCDGTASVAPTGGSGPGYTITWGPGNPVGQGTGQVSGLCPGDHTVTITDGTGCDTTYAFTITPFQPIVPTATVQPVRCHGECNGSIVLATTGGAGALAFQWTPEPGTGQGTASAGGLCPGDYAVTITDPAGCDTTGTWTITEPPALLFTVESVVDASCRTADDGAITISISGGVLGYAVTWSGPGGFLSADEDISGLLPGTYTLVVTDANQCQLTSTVDVGAQVSVVADAGPDRPLCSGTAIVLDGTASTGAATYQWTDGQGTPVGTGPLVDLGLLPDGTYTYILTVADGPCTDTDTLEITVLPLPVADAGPDRVLYVEGAVVLGGSPAGPPGSSFAWQPDSLLDHHDVPNPTATVDRTTWFHLVVVGPDGCIGVDSVLVTVIPEVKVPSGFTPNGDGHNDTWVLDFAPLFPAMEVQVFNRWGEPLFRSVGYAVPWDGRYDGKVVPMGTYYYVVDLHDERFPEALTGPLTIIR